MPQGGSSLGAILPLIFILAIFYIFILVPDKKRKNKYNSMIEALKVNDEVMTRGGILGNVVEIGDDFAIIQTGPDNVKFKIKKNGIAAILNEAVNETVGEIDSEAGNKTVTEVFQENPEVVEKKDKNLE